MLDLLKMAFVELRVDRTSGPRSRPPCLHLVISEDQNERKLTNFESGASMLLKYHLTFSSIKLNFFCQRKIVKTR